MGKYRIFVLVAALLLVTGALPVSAGRPARAQAKWTLMVYMVGDNNLERYALREIETEMAKVGSNADVNVVVILDRIPDYSKSAGDWTSTKLFYVTQGITADPQNALADWGEKNMGDPQTLIDFVQWAKSNYPADRYALLLWNHGWSWRPEQTMWDETDYDALDPHELAAALQVIGYVDVVGYDACEQQTIEVEAEWQNYTAAIAASQEDVWWEGFVHDHLLTAWQANPGMPSEQLAVEMARTMTDRTSAAVTMGASWGNLLTAVDQWSLALLNGLPTYRAAYDAAYERALSMAGDPVNKDLYDAALEIKANVPDPDIQAKSQAVMDAINAVVLYEWHIGKYKDAHGIGFFWPRLPADLDEPSSVQNDFEYYRAHLRFAQLTHWDEFIDAYVNQ